jgi:hypothetical protein
MQLLSLLPLSSFRCYHNLPFHNLSSPRIYIPAKITIVNDFTQTQYNQQLATCWIHTKFLVHITNNEQSNRHFLVNSGDLPSPSISVHCNTVKTVNNQKSKKYRFRLRWCKLLNSQSTSILTWRRDLEPSQAGDCAGEKRPKFSVYCMPEQIHQKAYVNAWIWLEEQRCFSLISVLKILTKVNHLANFDLHIFAETDYVYWTILINQNKSEWVD